MQSFDVLRKAIQENLRIQRDSGDKIQYIDVGNAILDICSKQNHVIFARRGCGKTLLLHYSGKRLAHEVKSVYLNCEDFKHHSFPNVLIEILSALFQELEKNLTGWFGKKKASREIIQKIIRNLDKLKQDSDLHTESIKNISSLENTDKAGIALDATLQGVGIKGEGAKQGVKKDETERVFTRHKNKLHHLDILLPELKAQIREFFKISSSVKAIYLQIDDLYHLRPADQAFVVDYIHRLCKDVPIYFKMATLRHASTLYVDRDGQPIGAQERHDYQSINIDYNLSDFKRTREQNWKILLTFAELAGMDEASVKEIFKGEGFDRLVMAGGGVPRDVLSLFLEVQSQTNGKIGKDDVRNLSLQNFERRIEELKQDSQGDEQDSLMRGIFVLRQFCWDKKINIFVVSEQLLQQHDEWRSLFNRLMDYRIIHLVGNAFTHKSQTGTYRAFAIDIGCYANLRKLEGRFTEISMTDSDFKDKIRSCPVLDEDSLKKLFVSVPENVEDALLISEAA